MRWFRATKQHAEEERLQTTKVRVCRPLKKSRNRKRKKKKKKRKKEKKSDVRRRKFAYAPTPLTFISKIPILDINIPRSKFNRECEATTYQYQTTSLLY
jgi:hypothetical protein